MTVGVKEWICIIQFSKSHSHRFGGRGRAAIVDFDHGLLTLDHLRHDTAVAVLKYILRMVCSNVKILYSDERKNSRHEAEREEKRDHRPSECLYEILALRRWRSLNNLARFSVWRWFVFLWDDGAPSSLSFFLLLFYPQLQKCLAWTLTVKILLTKDCTLDNCM